MAFLARFLQGLASAFIQTTMYSISTNFLSDYKSEMMGNIEAAIGIGLIFGAPIGSGLFWLGGYSLIYNGFGSAFILFSFLTNFCFGEEID